MSKFVHRTDAVPRTARLVLIGLFFAIMVLPPAAAQSTTPSDVLTSARISASLQIIAPIGIIGTNALNFGQVAATTSRGLARVEKDSPDAGRFEVNGVGNAPIQISFNAPDQLLRAAGAGELGIQLELYGSETLANAGSARRLLQGETVTLSNGRYYFFIGGALEVGPVSDNPPGMYTGQFELEVNYANL